MNNKNINDRPYPTLLFYNNNNSRLPNPANPGPGKSITGTEAQKFAMGRNISDYFQQVNAANPVTSRTDPNTGKEFTTRFKGTDSTQDHPLSRHGAMGGVGTPVQAAADVASGALSGAQDFAQINNQGQISNHYFQNVTGEFGYYNGMVGRAQMQAAAEGRGVEKANVWATGGKAVAGPIGHLAGLLIGQLSKDSIIDREMKGTNFKTLSTIDGKRIDPRDALTSTYRDPNASTDRGENVEMQHFTRATSEPSGTQETRFNGAPVSNQELQNFGVSFDTPGPAEMETSV